MLLLFVSGNFMEQKQKSSLNFFATRKNNLIKNVDINAHTDPYLNVGQSILRSVFIIQYSS